MSAASHDHSIANMERARLGVRPSDLDEPAPVIRLDDLDEATQRGLVDRYLRKYPFHDGLIGEAVNEHELCDDIRTSLMDGDTARLGQLVERAVVGYIGGCVEREHYEWVVEANEMELRK